ncbi:MAG TPA: malate dehydrogenase [Planctomycetota bacterium]|nr:malate dehydrogenase [Planctomycetota bacterium]
MKKPIKVAVTGAGGQIGYALIFRIAAGDVYGPDQPVSLGLLEITPALPALNGTLMELEDGAFPLLSSVKATDKMDEAFGDANWVVLVGGLPRKDGMTRADLIRANGPIFTGQGKAINDSAAGDVRILTVANPCNTNALIARSHAPKIPSERWYAMTRLDQNRAASQLAKKAGVAVGAVTRMTIWGNHSDTQYPDYKNAYIGGKPAPQVINDPAWLADTFIPTVAKRGAAVIKARGASSAASAANAAIDSLRSASTPNAAGDIFSAGVLADANPYGLPSGIVYSYPLTSSDGKGWKIAPGFAIDDDARKRLDASAAELKSEREAVKDLVGPAA